MMKKASKSIEFVSRKLLVNSKALSFIGKNGQVEWELMRTLAPLIDSVRAETGEGDVKYLEIIGYYERPESSITPKIEAFGASFFEGDQGNVCRIVYFVNIWGYDDLQAMPPDKRGEITQIGNSMPAWPETGSIVAVVNSVLLKFSSCSYPQIRQICEVRNIPIFCESAEVLTE